MVDYQPLFDDEDLPAWLKQAGITYGVRTARQAVSLSSTKIATIKPPWMLVSVVGNILPHVKPFPSDQPVAWATDSGQAKAYNNQGFPWGEGYSPSTNPIDPTFTDGVRAMIGGAGDAQIPEETLVDFAAAFSEQALAVTEGNFSFDEPLTTASATDLANTEPDPFALDDFNFDDLPTIEAAAAMPLAAGDADFDLSAEDFFAPSTAMPNAAPTEPASGPMDDLSLDDLFVGTPTSADTEAPLWDANTEAADLDADLFGGDPPAATTEAAANIEADLDFSMFSDDPTPAKPEEPLKVDDDWLASFGEPAAPAAPSGDDVPDWFKDDAEVQPVASSAITAGSPMASADDVPDWFKDDADPAPKPAIEEKKDTKNWKLVTPTTWFNDKTKLPSSPQIETPKLEEPDWMKGDETDLVSGYDAPTADFAVEDAAASANPDEAVANAGSDVPEWLRSMGPAATPTQGPNTLRSEFDLPLDFSALAQEEEATPAASSGSDLLGDLDSLGDLDWLGSAVDAGPTSSPAPSGQAAMPADDFFAALEAPSASRGGDDLDFNADLDLDSLLSLSDDVEKPAATGMLRVTPTEADNFNFDFNAQPFSGDVVSSSGKVAKPSKKADQPSAQPASGDPALDFNFDDLPMQPAASAPAASDVAAPAEPAPMPATTGRFGRRSLLPAAEPTPPAAAASLEAIDPNAFADPSISASPTAALEIPDWVSGMRKTDGAVVLQIGDQKVRMEDKSLNMLSEGLQRLREKTEQAAKVIQEKQTPSPFVGEKGQTALSGIQDAIKPARAFLNLTPTISAAGAVISDAEVARVKNLQGILNVQEEILRRRDSEEELPLEMTAEIAMKEAPVKSARRGRFKVDRLLISLLLLAAVIVPFFTNIFNVDLPTAGGALGIETRERIAAVDQALAPAVQGGAVLLAFEYAPTGAGELDDLARAVLGRLFAASAKPVIISTTPAGLLHAQYLVENLANNAAFLRQINRTSPLRANIDYTVLAYRGGGAAGVRAIYNGLGAVGLDRDAIFATTSNGEPSNLSANNLAALNMAGPVVFAESLNDVRDWVEQAPRAAGRANLPILFTTAAAGPVAQAYVSANRAVGPLSGLRDAIAYAGDSAGTVNPSLAKRWQALNLGAQAAGLVILLGALLGMVRYLAAGLKKRRGR
jgi:hypothetical protein